MSLTVELSLSMLVTVSISVPRPSSIGRVCLILLEPSLLRIFLFAEVITGYICAWPLESYEILASKNVTVA